MGLITKEVKIKLYSKNIKHFESLGYEIPRRKNNGRMCVPIDATIMVKTTDLMPYSTCPVDVECDHCKETLNIPYSAYTQWNHDKKYYCRHCAIKILNSGENNAKWNSNLTDEDRIRNRDYPEYDEFIKRVMARDKYTCQCCGETNNNSLDVHHLDGYNWCTEKRTDETNALVLCKTCHKNFHSLYGKGFNTKEQYEEWIGKAVELLKYDGALPTTRKVFDYEENSIYDSASQYGKIHNVNETTVRSVCNHEVRYREYCRKDGTKTITEVIANSVKGHHLFWLDEYENMTQDEKSSIINKKNKCIRKVICITTGKIFDIIVDGANEYNINTPGNITLNCQGKIKSAGKLPNGTKLEWMYYEDFLKLPIEEQNEILARNKDSSNDGSFIM